AWGCGHALSGVLTGGRVAGVAHPIRPCRAWKCHTRTTDAAVPPRLPHPLSEEACATAHSRGDGRTRSGLLPRSWVSRRRCAPPQPAERGFFRGLPGDGRIDVGSSILAVNRERYP